LLSVHFRWSSLQVTVVPSSAVPNCLRADPRSRLLSQSSEALTSSNRQVQTMVQTAPVAPAQEPVLQERRQPADTTPVASCSFSAPVKGATATVVVGVGAGGGITQDSDDAGCAAAIPPSVRCELVAGLMNECSVVDHLLVIDCRSFVAYNSNHVRGALNISCADCISRKRLLTGTLHSEFLF